MGQLHECTICKDFMASINEDFDKNIFKIECKTCGTFYCSYEYGKDYGKDKSTYLLQGAIREKNLQGIKPFFCTKDSEIIKSESFGTLNPISEKTFLKSINIPKTPIEKINKLLLNLANKTEDDYGKTQRINYEKDFPLIYAKNNDEIIFLLESIEEKGFMKDDSSRYSNQYEFQLSLKAWEKIEELKSINLESKQGFVACWFHDKHDKYREAIEKGIKNTGFKPHSIKNKDYPDTILEKAVGEIRKSRFVVVDLTEQRKTVFVEWGFAMGLNLETILVMSKKYYNENKEKNIEYYASNYNIKFYENEEHLTEIVDRAISARIGTKN